MLKFCRSIAVVLLVCAFSSCATQNYVAKQTVADFPPSVSADEVVIYADLDDVPSEVALVGEIEARSPKENTRAAVERIIREQTAASGGNGVYIIYNDPSAWSVQLHSGHGVMMLVSDTITSADGLTIGEQFIDYLDEKRERETIPDNIIFASAGYGFWGHSLVMPDKDPIYPFGSDLTAGYDRLLNDRGGCVGGMIAMHSTRFDLRGEQSGIDIIDFLPRVALRYRSTPHGLWAINAGAGYSFYKRYAAEADDRLSMGGFAYTFGFEFGFIFSSHFSAAVGFDTFGEIYRRGAHRIQRYNLRLGLNYMF